ncbi:type 2 isopentenyl-diphosphate Delta-isomerase [bacterium]|nr:type 2 isopentenyl-diphosphate Delta-isomerase [bacterium]
MKKSLKKPSTPSRKKDHVDICLTEDVNYQDKTAGFELYEFVHNALPELNLKDIDTSVRFLKKDLYLPLMITGMTGGYKGAAEINGNLALVCEDKKLALGLGSQRQALEDDSQLESYTIVRKNAPTIPIIGNIGVAQVIKGLNIKRLQKLLDDIEADALAIHLNALQEAVQFEGDVNFQGALDGISRLVKKLKIPIIAKETGAGISYSVAKRLHDVGIQYIDVSGSGGTSWSAVESFRKHAGESSEDRNRLAKKFHNWGIPTTECIQQVSRIKKMTVIASGGIKDGSDIAKSIALGADMAGMARPLLKILMENGAHALGDEIDYIQKELKLAMFLTGSKNIKKLRKAEFTFKT